MRHVRSDIVLGGKPEGEIGRTGNPLEDLFGLVHRVRVVGRDESRVRRRGAGTRSEVRT